MKKQERIFVLQYGYKSILYLLAFGIGGFLLNLAYIICLEMIYKFTKPKDILSYPTLVYMGIFSFIIGILFAIENLIIEIRKSGKWEINLDKIIFCVLPLLMFASFNFIYNSTPGFWIYPRWLVGLFQYFIQDVFIESVAQVLLGYALVTSFYKGSINPKNE